SRPDMAGPAWDAPPRAYEYGPQVEWVIITVRTPDHTASMSVSGPDSVGTGAVSTGAPRVPAKYAASVETPTVEPATTRVAAAAAAAASTPVATTTPFMLTQATNVPALT